ncbi:MAG: phosphate uptake regulator PhoU [Marine Group I thaumarchaeote]|nr:MAG: phosphate uptake regulator PhoU [Marine Group I thaumarchaeote]
MQKIGSSIHVSLPKDWIEANQLAKSDEVELNVGSDSLSITVSKENRPSKELVISYPLLKEENIVADITGAYLLGYDLIRIKGKSAISAPDREKIRGSMRRLVGMEIVEEDSTNVNMQFLLDSTTLNPRKILKRMSSITLGMFRDTLETLVSMDKTTLQTIPNRDDEIDRQYFLLVRLIRSTMIDQRLASALNLQNIDFLDYRVAANLIETAGDTIVEFANSIQSTTLNKNNLRKIYDLGKKIENIQEKSISAFIENNRSLAIEAIVLHKEHQRRILNLRSSLEQKKQIPLDFLDLLYIVERIERSWSDISDLVKPVYN